jgi:hypothetical protein
MLRSLRLRTNYVIRVMRIKDKGDRKINSNNYKEIKSVVARHCTFWSRIAARHIHQQKYFWEYVSYFPFPLVDN